MAGMWPGMIHPLIHALKSTWCEAALNTHWTSARIYTSAGKPKVRAEKGEAPFLSAGRLRGGPGTAGPT